jgi:hypothetical protein
VQEKARSNLIYPRKHTKGLEHGSRMTMQPVQIGGVFFFHKYLMDKRKYAMLEFFKNLLNEMNVVSLNLNYLNNLIPC